MSELSSIPGAAPGGAVGHPLPPWRRFHQGAVIIILALGLALYAYTLNFPFVFDDYIYLVDNPLMKDGHSFVWMGDFVKFANHSRDLGLDPDLSTNLILRPFAYLTFYLNFMLDGMIPRGFRAVNIMTHCANAVLLFLLLSRVLGTSRKRGVADPFSVGFISLSAALLFLVHPLQIESVTYIVQRFTSLGTFFYLLTILTYLMANGAGDWASSRWLRAVSVGSLITGMFTKEFLFTVPFMIILLDWLVIGTALNVVVRRALPYLFCLPIIPLLIVFTASAQTEGGAYVSAAFNITNGAGYPQYHYALTQLCVIMTYLRLLILPMGLHIDWDFPLFTSFLQGPVMVSALAIAVMLAGTWYGYRRYGKDVRHALLCYSILWFFMTISIDSSIIPLPDLVAEHRTYLPSIGILCALACGADLVRTASGGRRRLRYYAIHVLMLIWIMTLAAATTWRHQVWRSEISIWKDSIAKSPKKARPWLNLAAAYYERKQPDLAAFCLRNATLLQPGYAVAYRDLGRVLNELGRHREALSSLLVGVSLAPGDYKQHHELAVAYTGLGDFEHGEVEFLKGIRLCPAYRPTHLALGDLYVKRQQHGKALEQLTIAASLHPLDHAHQQLVDRMTEWVRQEQSRDP